MARVAEYCHEPQKHRVMEVCDVSVFSVTLWFVIEHDWSENS
jgi:hypothetical protein